jgi:hypothetical protein
MERTTRKNAGALSPLVTAVGCCFGHVGGHGRRRRVSKPGGDGVSCPQVSVSAVTARLVANPAGRRGSRIACDGAVVITITSVSNPLFDRGAIIEGRRAHCVWGDARLGGQPLHAFGDTEWVGELYLLVDGFWSAPRGTRTPNRQIRRLVLSVHAVRPSALMLLRSDAESSQTATVLAGNGWWTDTQTDTPVGGELSGGPGSRGVPLLPYPDSRAESPSGLPSDSRRLPLNRRPLMALSHH